MRMFISGKYGISKQVKIEFNHTANRAYSYDHRMAVGYRWSVKISICQNTGDIVQVIPVYGKTVLEREKNRILSERSSHRFNDIEQYWSPPHFVNCTDWTNSGDQLRSVFMLSPVLHSSQLGHSRRETKA